MNYEIWKSMPLDVSVAQILYDGKEEGKEKRGTLFVPLSPQDRSQYLSGEEWSSSYQPWASVKHHLHPVGFLPILTC